MIVVRIIFIVTFLLMSLSCFWNGGEENANGAANGNSPENSPAVTGESPSPDRSITQPESNVVPETAKIESLSSPSAAYTTYSVATLNKDIKAIKQTLSKGSLQFLEKAAREKNSSVEEMLTGGFVEYKVRKISEIRNEKIIGNNATIEVKNEMGSYDLIPMVKEDGEWKVALDELNKRAQDKFKEIQKRLSETK